jgi:hypothetical protein
MQQRVLIAVIVVVVAACAADDPTPPPAGHGLLGTWRYVSLRQDTPLEDRQLLVFGADGRYSLRDRGGVESGVFEIAGDDVTIRSNAGRWVTTGYAVTHDRLIVDALFPAGETDGLIGIWTGVQSTNDASSTIELALRPDGTAHLSQTGSLTDDVDAIWTHEDPYAVITFAGVPRPKSFPAFAGVAIGEWLYERLPR